MYVRAKRHKKGQLVIFDPAVKKLEGIPFITCPWDRNDKFWIYEKIDMTTFPSWNDFVGFRVSVARGTYCVILQDLGMPEGLLFFNSAHSDIDLHIYSILIKGRTVEVFGCDLCS